MKKIISAVLITSLLMVSTFSALTVNAKVFESYEVLLEEDFEPAAGFEGAFTTDAYKYLSMFSASDIAAGNFEGYNGWRLTASAGDEQNITPSIYHVAQRTDVGSRKENTTTYLDLRRYVSSTSIPSIYKNFGTQSKADLRVRFSLDLLYSNAANGFRFSAKYFADLLTISAWKPMNGTEYTFTSDEKALFKTNEWNKIEFLLDYTKNEISLFVNGTQVGTTQTVNQTADFKEIRLWGMNDGKLIGQNLYIDNLKLEKVRYIDENYIANGATYTNEAGAILLAGNTLKNVRIEKDAQADGEGTVIVARYDSSGKLINAVLYAFTGEEFSNNTAWLDINEALASGDYVKVFFLNMGELKSLAKASFFSK